MHKMCVCGFENKMKTKQIEMNIKSQCYDYFWAYDALITDLMAVAMSMSVWISLWLVWIESAVTIHIAYGPVNRQFIPLSTEIIRACVRIHYVCF